MCKRRYARSWRILIAFSFAVGAGPAATAPQARAGQAYGQLPLHFEANQGQLPADVRFLSRGPGYSLYLTAGEARLVLARPKQDREPVEQRATQTQAAPVTVRMSLVGAQLAPRVSGLEEFPAKANYFIGKDPAKWRTNVPTYAKVHYREIYRGIELLYHGNQRQLEYDFIVAPKADLQQIVLGFEGADRVEIDAAGELVLHTAAGVLRQRKPLIYQEIDASRRPVAGGYVRKGANRVGFQVAAYDRTRALVIDPVFAYATYLGGNGDDDGYAIAVDVHGNAYVTGFTTSGDFPTTAGAVQPTVGESVRDAFVAKLDPTGTALIYSTYLGGDRTDTGYGIAVDLGGNAYIAGVTISSNFPTTPGALQTTFGGGEDGDGFVSKLDPTGSALVYSTYLGGDKLDHARGVAVDLHGNAYVTGITTSLDFPTTPGAFQPVHSRVTHPPPPSPFTLNLDDGFVTKLDRTGTRALYSTYLGGAADTPDGSGREGGTAIAVDLLGNAYVAGYTNAATFPTTPGAFQPTAPGRGDAFVTKLNRAGSALIYSTYLGGSFRDSASALGIDLAGNAYVAGTTESSTDFPTTPGAFQTTFGGGWTFGTLPTDTFVTKLNPSGSGLVYSTYMGGSRNDYSTALAVDLRGNAYISGYTQSGPYDACYSPFLSKLNRAGAQVSWSSDLGQGSCRRLYIFGIALDLRGSVYVTGSALDSLPTTPGAFQPSFGGVWDAFVVKMEQD